MSIIATISIPAEDFTLGEALTANSGIRVHLERVVPVGDTFIPYFWASDDDLEAVSDELEDEPDIETFTIIDSVNHQALVRVEWAEDLDGLLEAIADARATIMEGIGESDRWQFRLRFDDHERLTEFYRRCNDQGLSLQLEAVHNPGLPTEQTVAANLSPIQRETLQLAFEKGYFDVPRGINLVELAEELELSDSAVSQRLRGGIAALLGTTLVEDRE